MGIEKSIKMGIANVRHEREKAEEKKKKMTVQKHE